MSTALSELLVRWQRLDLLHRLGESAIRLVCWAAVVLFVVPRALWLAACGFFLVGEATWIWHRWRSPPQVAAAVDMAANTHGLLHSALAAEHDRAWGSPALIALVQAQALATAPGLTAHAIRRLRFPRAPLAIGLLSLIALLLPVQTERGQTTTRLAAQLAPTPTEETPTLASVPAAPKLEHTLGDGEGALAGGDADAWAERGEGEAGATGTAGDGSSSGQARQGAEGAGDAAAEAGTAAGKSNSSSAEAGDAADENQRTGGGQAGTATADSAEVDDQSPTGDVLDKETERTGKRVTSDGPPDTGDNILQQIDLDRIEEFRDDRDNSVGSGTMMSEDSSALTEDTEETASNTLGLAIAGQGGINDAPGTVNLLEAPVAEDIETTEEWIAARWRASAAGTLQTIDGGQSGGQSNQAWVELYTDYAALAESRMHQEEIPPGRRGFVSAYFESIRSEP